MMDAARNAFDASAALPALPDLQALVVAHGDYGLIPSDAWSAYDAAAAQWRTARIAHLQAENEQNLHQFRASVRKPAGKPGKPRR
jgi:hypothetical protein